MHCRDWWRGACAESRVAVSHVGGTAAPTQDRIQAGRTGGLTADAVDFPVCRVGFLGAPACACADRAWSRLKPLLRDIAVRCALRGAVIAAACVCLRHPPPLASEWCVLPRVVLFAVQRQSGSTRPSSGTRSLRRATARPISRSRRHAQPSGAVIRHAWARFCASTIRSRQVLDRKRNRPKRGVSRLARNVPKNWRELVVFIDIYRKFNEISLNSRSVSRRMSH